MTPAEALALGRRALAAGFVPADGALMLVRSYHRAHVEDGPDLFWWSGPWGERCDCGNVPSGERYRSDQDTEGDREVLGPDFRDAATLGVLEAQVRAKHRDLQTRVLTAYRDGAWPQTITLSADHATFESFMAAPEWLTALRRQSEEVGALLVRAYQLRMVPDDGEAETQSVLALVAALEARP